MSRYKSKHITRQATNRVLEMIDDGVLDKDMVITACLKYMSEDDVKGMAHANGFFEGDEDEDDEDES